MKHYFLGLFIAVDQFFNALFGGMPDHTISGRVGYAAIQKKRWGLIMEKIINILFFFDDDHCRKAVEWDEVKNKGQRRIL